MCLARLLVKMFNHPPSTNISLTPTTLPPIINTQKHYACANEASEDVLVMLAEQFPESKTSVDKRKRTPLHFALGHTERPANVATVVLLSGTGAALMADENGMLVSCLLLVLLHDFSVVPCMLRGEHIRWVLFRCHVERGKCKYVTFYTLASYVPNPCIQKRGNVMVLHFSEEFH